MTGSEPVETANWKPGDGCFIRCQVVRWVADEPFPGLVEAQFTDAHDRLWVFRDKSAMFAQVLTSRTRYPVAAVIAGTVSASRRDADARDIVIISTGEPWGLESVEGSSTFEVTAAQLVREA